MKAVLAALMLLGAIVAAAEQVFAAPADLGATRGICIGTVEECVTRPAPEPALDLMVNFELDSAELTEEARAKLLEFLEVFDDPRFRDARFSIEGHTDAWGTESYNQRLSERRAAAVVRFLSDQGADPSRFVVTGLGESRPRTDDPFDAINRRVETRIVQGD